MSLDDALALATEAQEALRATADALTAVLADEAIDRDDVYLAACQRLELDLVEPTRDHGICTVCGADGAMWKYHSRWHLRQQAAIRFAQHQAALSAKTTMVLGACLAEMFGTS